MFEKFTEKAINVVSEAQQIAKDMRCASVQPEHLMLAIIKEAKGMSLKLFKSNNIDFESAKTLVEEKLRFEKTDKVILNIPFSYDFKELLKKTLDYANKSENNYILFEHLFLAVISEKHSYVGRILQEYDFDILKAKEILSKLVQKKSKRLSHPEGEDETESNYLQAESVFDSVEAKSVFERAVAKLSASIYEILGTEQIVSSILEDSDSELAEILNSYGITATDFDERLAKQQSRQAEFEDKKVVFTPNAFIALNLALQTAKELGSSEVKPEHMILGLLKAKKGVAYDVLKTFSFSDDDLAHSIIKPIEKQMPEALTILRLAKQEARRLGRNVVGTEMFLLGILAEASGVGAVVLSDLEITIKDARIVVENLIGYGNEYYDTEITFTKRAKKVLERAWNLAKKDGKPKIESAHLLQAITMEPTSLAMKSLEQLGVDAVEIRQGIIKEAEKQ